MPVEGLGKGDAEVVDAIGGDEAVANLDRLRLVAEKIQKSLQNQGLADGKEQKHQAWRGNGQKGAFEGEEAASDEAKLVSAASQCYSGVSRSLAIALDRLK